MPTTKWTEVDVNFGSSFYDVTDTKHGTIAVGSGGTVYRQTESGAEFLTREGVDGNSRNLRTIGTTGGEKRVWFGGNSGALGCYDFEADEIHDFSNPRGQGGTWRDIHITGKAGSEHVYIVDDSGQLAALTIDGTEQTNVDLVKPLSTGSTMNGITRDSTGRFYLVNSIGQLFTASTIDDWSKTELTDTSLIDVVVDQNHVYAATSGGTLLTYSPDAGSTKETDLGIGTVYDLDKDGDRIVVSGTSGQVVEVTEDKPTIQETPVNVSLYGLSFGSTIAVGGNGAFVVGRKKQGTDEASTGGSKNSAKDGSKAAPKDESKTSAADGSKQESAEGETTKASAKKEAKQQSTEDVPEGVSTQDASKGMSTQDASKQGSAQDTSNKSQSSAGTSNTEAGSGSGAKETDQDNSDRDDPDEDDPDDEDDEDKQTTEKDDRDDEDKQNTDKDDPDDPDEDDADEDDPDENSADEDDPDEDDADENGSGGTSAASNSS